MKIGRKIRNIRKRKGLTLEDLSLKSGLSISYLSNIEREVNSPTIQNLQKICDSFGIDMPELLEKRENRKRIVHRDERREIIHLKGRVKYESISEGLEHIEGVCMTVKGGSNVEEISEGHYLDEFGIITNGALEMEIGESKYILNEGDSIFIPAKTPHIYRNLWDKDCISYWVYIEGSRNVGDGDEYETD